MQDLLDNATQLGPFKVSQRATAIVIDQTNAQRWYLGKDVGGHWISDYAGVNWSKFDPTNNLGSKITDIEQDSKNPNIICDASTWRNPNAGVFRSFDSAVTFETLVSPSCTFISQSLILKQEKATFIGCI